MGRRVCSGVFACVGGHKNCSAGNAQWQRVKVAAAVGNVNGMSVQGTICVRANAGQQRW